MSQIVRLPKPPYYVVVAPAVLAGDLRDYPETALRLMEAAQSIQGFLGIETCLQPGFAIAVSYWESLDAIQAWRSHPEHRRAKKQAKAIWFDEYATRIAKVEIAY